MPKKSAKKKNGIETSNPGIVAKNEETVEQLNTMTDQTPVEFENTVVVRQERRVYGIEYGNILREKPYFDRRRGVERVKRIRGLGCKRGDQTHYVPVFHSRDIPKLRELLDKLEKDLQADEAERAEKRQKEAEEGK